MGFVHWSRFFLLQSRVDLFHGSPSEETAKDGFRVDNEWEGQSAKSSEHGDNASSGFCSISDGESFDHDVVGSSAIASGSSSGSCLAEPLSKLGVVTNFASAGSSAVMSQDSTDKSCTTASRECVL